MHELHSSAEIVSSFSISRTEERDRTHAFIDSQEEDCSATTLSFEMGRWIILLICFFMSATVHMRMAPPLNAGDIVPEVDPLAVGTNTISRQPNSIAPSLASKPVKPPMKPQPQPQQQPQPQPQQPLPPNQTMPPQPKTPIQTQTQTAGQTVRQPDLRRQVQPMQVFVRPIQMPPPQPMLVTQSQSQSGPMPMPQPMTMLMIVPPAQPTPLLMPQMPMAQIPTFTLMPNTPLVAPTTMTEEQKSGDLKFDLAGLGLNELEVLVQQFRTHGMVQLPNGEVIHRPVQPPAPLIPLNGTIPAPVPLNPQPIQPIVTQNEIKTEETKSKITEMEKSAVTAAQIAQNLTSASGEAGRRREVVPDSNEQQHNTIETRFSQTPAKVNMNAVCENVVATKAPACFNDHKWEEIMRQEIDCAPKPKREWRCYCGFFEEEEQKPPTVVKTTP